MGQARSLPSRSRSQSMPAVSGFMKLSASPSSSARANSGSSVTWMRGWDVATRRVYARCTVVGPPGLESGPTGRGPASHRATASLTTLAETGVESQRKPSAERLRREPRALRTVNVAGHGASFDQSSP